MSSPRDSVYQHSTTSPLTSWNSTKESPLKIVITVLQGSYFETHLVCNSPWLSLHAKHVDAVLFLPTYSSLRLHLLWKRWLDLTGKEQLCIINWEDGIRPPGPDFNAKMLGAGDLHRITGSYVDTILGGGEDYEAFSVVRWTTGASDCHHPNNTILMFL
jgi:hypothetical protein